MIENKYKLKRQTTTITTKFLRKIYDHNKCMLERKKDKNK